jgi:hypothetical protein
LADRRVHPIVRLILNNPLRAHQERRLVKSRLSQIIRLLELRIGEIRLPQKLRPSK